MDDNTRAILYPFLEELESTHLSSYPDEKGNITIGTGFNVDAPGAERHLKVLNLDKNKIKAGEQQIDEPTARRLLDMKLHETENLFKHEQKNFPATELNPAQKAALISMMYNNPSLMGPELREHINQNDTEKVVREILLRSNKEKSPGIQKRRLREAELYADPVVFNNTLKNMSEDELDQIRSTLDKMDNREEYTRLQALYPVLQKEAMPASKRPKDMLTAPGYVRFNKFK